MTRTSGTYFHSHAAAWRAGIYFTTYSRALWSYAANAFATPELDADDIAFIEDVRERGTVACGSLAEIVPTPVSYDEPRSPLAEELDFWKLPYAVDKIAVRRHGPVHRPPTRPAGITPNAERLRRNRELAAAALAEEQRLKARQLEQRQLEQLLRDIEWEKNEPKPRFGRVEKRHYVPQWKVDELEAKKPPWLKAKEAAAKASAEKARAALRALRAAEAAAKVESLRRCQDGWVDASPNLDKARVEAERARKKALALQAKARRALAQSKAALARDVEQERDQRREGTKNFILRFLRSVFPQVVTLEGLTAASGTNDKDLVMSCIAELIQQGLLARETEKADDVAAR